MLTSAVRFRSVAEKISSNHGSFAPHVLGEWSLLRPVAQGTWTTVFQAAVASGDLNRPPRYAIKTPRADLVDNDIARNHLSREAEIGRSVIHPHVVPILAWKLTGSHPYVVMPWLGGLSLQKLLDRQGTVPPADAIWLMRQAAEGLAAVHAAGWLHADLKPSNIMVNPEGHVTIIDFGFARRIENSKSRALDVVGTLDYIAPEWFLGNFPLDAKSDLYSLGVIFFEMLAGRRPYSIRTLREAARVHRQRCIPDIRTFNPSVSHDVSRLIRQMISPFPERRPSSAALLAETLVALEIEHFTLR
ncbi:MAG: serine/threonine-protein kinase [Thermogutta sp.]